MSQSWSWLFGSAFLCCGASLLSDIPLRIFGLPLPEPLFPAVLAFSWAIANPTILSSCLLILIGFFLDIMWYSPLGFWSFCLIIFYGLAFLLRRLVLGQSTSRLAWWYVGFTIFDFTLACCLVRWRTGSLPNFLSLGCQAGITIALFPLALFLTRRLEDTDIRST